MWANAISQTILNQMCRPKLWNTGKKMSKGKKKKKMHKCFQCVIVYVGKKWAKF